MERLTFVFVPRTLLVLAYVLGELGRLTAALLAQMLLLDFVWNCLISR